jgi:hypothetical protein
MSAAKDNEKRARQNFAAKHAKLRDVRFETFGFGSNMPTPSLASAGAMAGKNRRAMIGGAVEREMATQSIHT